MSSCGDKEMSSVGVANKAGETKRSFVGEARCETPTCVARLQTDCGNNSGVDANSLHSMRKWKLKGARRVCRAVTCLLSAC